MEYGQFVSLVFLGVAFVVGAWLFSLSQLVRALMELEPELWLSLGSPRMSLGTFLGGGVPAWGMRFGGWIGEGGPGVQSPRVRSLVKRSRVLMIGCMVGAGIVLWCLWGMLTANLGGGGGVRTGG